MDLAAKNKVKVSLVSSVLFLLFISGFIRLHSSQAQTGFQEEQKVRETLKSFKEGIEKGDLELCRRITTEDFYPFFKGFYESLAR